MYLFLLLLFNLVVFKYCYAKQLFFVWMFIFYFVSWFFFYSKWYLIYFFIDFTFESYWVFLVDIMTDAYYNMLIMIFIVVCKFLSVSSVCCVCMYLFVCIYFLFYIEFLNLSLHWFNFVESFFSYSYLFNISFMSGLFVVHPPLMFLYYALSFYFFMKVIFYFYSMKYFLIGSFFKVFVNFWSIYMCNLFCITTIVMILGMAWASMDMNWAGWWSWDPMELVNVFFILNLLNVLHWSFFDKNFYKKLILMKKILIMNMVFLVMNSSGMFLSLHSFELVDKDFDSSAITQNNYIVANTSDYIVVDNMSDDLFFDFYFILLIFLFVTLLIWLLFSSFSMFNFLSEKNKFFKKLFFKNYFNFYFKILLILMFMMYFIEFFQVDSAADLFIELLKLNYVFIFFKKTLLLLLSLFFFYLSIDYFRFIMMLVFTVMFGFFESIFFFFF